MKRYSALIVVLLYCALSYGQSTVLSTGGDGSGSGGTFSYSVGQIDYNYILDSGGTALEGVQHPIEIFHLFIADISLSRAKIYPNPTDGNIHIQLERNYSAIYRLYDMNGHLVNSTQRGQNKFIADLSEFERGVYILELELQNKDIERHKIIKW